MGAALSPPEITEARRTDSSAAMVWQIWCELTADLLRTLTLTVDPDIIALAGGLSKIPDVAKDLNAALLDAQLGDFGVPPIACAQGGDSSGARGAAYAAMQEAGYV